MRSKPSEWSVPNTRSDVVVTSGCPGETPTTGCVSPATYRARETSARHPTSRPVFSSPPPSESGSSFVFTGGAMRRVLERLMSIGAAPVSAVDAGHGARSPSGRKAYHPGIALGALSASLGLLLLAPGGARGGRWRRCVTSCWPGILNRPRCPGATPGELQRRGGQPRALLRRGSRRVVLTAEMRASAERFAGAIPRSLRSFPGSPFEVQTHSP